MKSASPLLKNLVSICNNFNRKCNRVNDRKLMFTFYDLSYVSIIILLA